MNEAINIEQARARYPMVSRRSIYYWMQRHEIEWMQNPQGGRLIVVATLERRIFRRLHEKQMFEPGRGEQCRAVDPDTKACCMLVRFHDASINATPHLFGIDGTAFP